MFLKKPSKQNANPRKIFVLMLLVFLVSALGFFYLTKNKYIEPDANINQTDEASVPKTETSTAPIKNTDVPQANVKQVDLAIVKESIQKVIAKHPELSVGVSFVNIKTGDKVDVNGDQVFVAASTTKVLVAIDFLHEVENGKYSLDTLIRGRTVRYHLEQMISQSNNNSWYAINNLLTYKGEQSYAASIGIKYDSLANTITPNNMSNLLTELYKYELINKKNTDLLLSFMSKTHNMQLIPSSQINVKTYNKTGWLGGFIHDVAILDDGANQYSLAIYTDGNTAMEDRIGLFHEITETAYGLSKTN